MLARAARDGSAVVVAFIDLDDFKSINDRHGHAIGDEFLRAVSQRLVAAQRAGDLVSRFGGDEFVVFTMVAAQHSDASARAIRNRLSACLAGSYEVGEATIDYAGASVGTAVSGVDGDAIDSLVSKADAAMYEHKKARQAASAEDRSNGPA